MLNQSFAACPISRLPGGAAPQAVQYSYYGAQMARTVQARLDARTEDDLALIRSQADCSDSQAIRLALRETANRRRRRSALRHAAAAVAADPAERAEMERVREEMDELAAPWPEA